MGFLHKIRCIEQKKREIFFLLLLTMMLSSCASPNRQHLSTDSQIQQEKNREKRQRSTIIHYTGFSVSYNPETRQPDWVSYMLTAEQVEQTKHTPKISRYFMPDPYLDLPQATNEDYSSSGWVRGHMARRQDMKWSEHAVKESDYFTNSCPQNKEMNNGVWHQIENLARQLAVRYDSVQIVCGPIFVSKTPETIGPNQVWIPNSFFKAFLIKHQDAYHTIAFICPNNPDSVTIVGTAQSVNSVESFTGYDFFSFLDDGIEEDVEDEVEVGLWLR